MSSIAHSRAKTAPRLRLIGRNASRVPLKASKKASKPRKLKPLIRSNRKTFRTSIREKMAKTRIHSIVILTLLYTATAKLLTLKTKIPKI